MTQPVPDCWIILVPRYEYAKLGWKNKKDSPWCVTHGKWNCKDGIIKT